MITIDDIKFVYINLDERKDKKEYMENMLSSMNLNYDRFTATKPTIDSIQNQHKSYYDRSVNWIKNHSKSNDPKKAMPALSTLGCYISHHKLLKKYSNCKYLISLEDDCFLNQSLLEEFLGIINDNKKLNDANIIRPNMKWLRKYPSEEFVDEQKDYAKFTKCHQIASSDSDSHLFYGASNFVFYNNVQTVLSYMNDSIVCNVDAIWSTNIVSSYMLNVKIHQRRDLFISDINNKRKTTMKKIFLIGFNKCATRSITNFIAKANNINKEQVHHHRQGEIASHIFSDVHTNTPLLSRYPNIDDVIVFADMENSSQTNGALPIMGYEFFEEIYNAYPNAYYILNYRNCEDWIESRTNHNAHLGHHRYINRWKKLYKVDENEIIDMWRKSFHAHIKNVRDFFQGDKSKQLLEYHINNDSRSKIVEFLDQLDFPKDAKLGRIGRAKSNNTQQQNQWL